MFLPSLIIIFHQIISSFLYRFVLLKNKVSAVSILLLISSIIHIIRSLYYYVIYYRLVSHFHKYRDSINEKKKKKEKMFNVEHLERQFSQIRG